MKINKDNVKDQLKRSVQPQETTGDLTKMKLQGVTKNSEKPFRQILIETDGNNIFLRKAEVSGNIELVGILENLASFLKNGTAKS